MLISAPREEPTIQSVNLLSTGESLAVVHKLHSSHENSFVCKRTILSVGSILPSWPTQIYQLPKEFLTYAVCTWVVTGTKDGLKKKNIAQKDWRWFINSIQKIYWFVTNLWNLSFWISPYGGQGFDYSLGRKNSQNALSSML